MHKVRNMSKGNYTQKKKMNSKCKKLKRIFSKKSKKRTITRILKATKRTNKLMNKITKRSVNVKKLLKVICNKRNKLNNKQIDACKHLTRFYGAKGLTLNALKNNKKTLRLNNKKTFKLINQNLRQTGILCR